jgi:hypothetical protein
VGARSWALEGCGAYGAGLGRHLLGAGERVMEIDRPERRGERTAAKSDALDALRAARTALARAHQSSPRADGSREVLRVPMVAPGWQQGGNKTGRDEPRRTCLGRTEIPLANDLADNATG